METDKCAFAGTMMNDIFHCTQAEAVTRRGGPDIACTSPPAQARCAAVLEHIKAAVLPALGLEDDLLSLPHSMLLKLQFGGLLGLQAALDPAAGAATEVADIDALVTRVLQTYGDKLDGGAPGAELVEPVRAFQLKRRQGGRRS